MLRVKICGITSPQDAQAAAAAGADAIGLNFVGGPRRVDLRAATSILGVLPPFCTPVALVDVSHGDVPEDLLELLGRSWVSHLQLYGHVTADVIHRLLDDGFKPILVQHVVPDTFPENVNRMLACLGGAAPTALLLDAYHEGAPGGTGMTADWAAIAAALAGRTAQEWPPVILAGGLNPRNVAEAVRTVRPWAVDVSSGVESSPGRKDAAKMRAFIEQVRAASEKVRR